MKTESTISSIESVILKQAFPFHFVVNDAGEIISCGDALNRVLAIDTLVRESLYDHFIFQHPVTKITTVDELKDHQDSFFLIKARGNNKLILRGQLITFAEFDLYIFLVSPWVTDLDVLDELGLTLSDFPLHSPMSDFLNLVQAQRASLLDSKRLSNEMRNLNKELEQRVVRRTLALELNTEELKESNEKLEHEISERARMEVELRHANKLEAVGQLAAGIAHEINTPIQYVGNSLQYLKNVFSDLQDFSVNVENHLTNDNIVAEDWRAELENIIDDVDFIHIRKRAPKAIDRALEGISRVTHIVRAMNEFSYPDGDEKTGADLNKALETTLTVAKSEYKYVARIVREFETIPSINCYPGDLNQVFLNLIVNAAHAISDHLSEEGVITIKTWKNDENEVAVSISDNGSGIPENIRHRIFDPFFTTKEVGKGTGQGLAISHNIITNKHAGRLTFTSELGKGTTFLIILPVSSNRTEADTLQSTDIEDIAA